MKRLKTFLHRRTKSKASEREVSDSTPPDPQDEEGYTMKLPTELLIAIFSLLGRNSDELLSVTGVCRRWRAITVQTPDLWTKITIHLPGITTIRTQKCIHRTNLFLGRAKDSPLDVEWQDSGNQRSVSIFLEIFRRRGPFCRWRSLSLSLDPETTFPFDEVREIDSFSNLEFLKFKRAPPFRYLDHISKTVTGKLYTLELGANLNVSRSHDMEYRRILNRINTLRLWTGVTLPPGLLLPPNIITVDANTLPALSIPNIRHLCVKTMDFEVFSASNPVNLVTLGIFTRVRTSPTDSTITLPNLQWLEVKGTAFPALSFLKAPSLHTLSIEHRTGGTQTIDGPLLTALCNRFEAPKLLILWLVFHMDGPATLKTLRSFPLLSRIDIAYRDAESAEKALSHVFPRERDPTLCSNLDLLRVILDTRPVHQPTWEGFVRDTALRIGDPLWRMESVWRGGSYFSQVGEGEKERTPLIFPWREGRRRCF